MDLPTYTSIWRIEKRLYKLYDFRLPMPLPIGQVAVFVAIAVPYVLLLTVLGLPFNHTLIWLYLLPPGFLTWLVTRPVLESKRLPELVKSQLRYLAEPRILCRMSPLAEHDVVLVTGRIWRPRTARGHADVLADQVADAGFAPAEERAAEPVTTPGRMRRGPLPPMRTRDLTPPAADRQPSPGALPAWIAAGSPDQESGRTAHAAGPAMAVQPALVPRVPRRVTPAEFRLAAAGRPAPSSPPDPPERPKPFRPDAADSAKPADSPAEVPAQAGQDAQPARPAAQPAEREASQAPVASEPGDPAAPQRPVVTVVGPAAGRTAAPSVERALAGPSARRGDLRAGRVAVVPGGHRPGKPDMLQRDRARAQLPLGIRPRIIVLGCTVGPARQ